MKATVPGTKGEKTKQKIIRAAMYCLAKHGDRDTTFQKIADKCQLSQPLIVHYFKSREEIFPTVLNYMLEKARQDTIESLIKAHSAREKLMNYLEVSLNIFREAETANIYITLYHFSSFNARFRQINTEIKRVAVARIVDIINGGIKTGEFKKVNVPVVAKSIHNNLSGMLINVATEIPQFTDKELLEQLQKSAFATLEALSQ